VKILISGAGIAGPSLAYWLVQYGFDVAIVEKAPSLRTGGYIIDFWGAGYDIAERMGLLPEIQQKGYMLREVRVVDATGNRVAGFPAAAFSRMTKGRYVSLPRGDLAASIFGKIRGKVETIFGDGVSRIEQVDSAVDVTFQNGAKRSFDLIIGADGLHSRIREIVYGPEKQFEHYLGYKAAAFEIGGYRPRDELIYVMYTQVGQQAARFAMRGERTMFLFTFADSNVSGPDDVPSQKALLRERFGGSGWECPEILRALDSAENFYFDRVSQIKMRSEPGSWTRGRVTLLGDAAFCVSLLAGQGSSLAMVAAYILAGELHRAGGGYKTAFARYEQIFGPFVAGKQKAALRFAGTFAPKSKFALFLRNQAFKLAGIPLIADLAVGRGVVDKIRLPEY